MSYDICYVYPYHDNPMMLETQVFFWNQIAKEYPTFQVVLVDDCSPNYPAEEIFKKFKGNKLLYRFTEPACWTQHEARNLGAMIGAEGYPWLFMSDIDIVLEINNFRNLQAKNLKPDYNYTFERLIATQSIHDEHVFVPFRYHCNTYLLRRDTYMQINGYDVDYCGAHGGGYGGDGEFERQLSRITPRKHLDDVHVLGFGRTSESQAIGDADTSKWDREEWKKKYRKVFDRKRAHGDMKSYNPIRRAWERII